MLKMDINRINQINRIQSNIQLFIHIQIRKYCEDANERNAYDNLIKDKAGDITYYVGDIYEDLRVDEYLEFFDMVFDKEDIVNVDKYKVQYDLTSHVLYCISLPF